MYSSFINAIARSLFILALPVIFLTACSEDDPVTPPEEHFEAEGLVLKSSGIEVVRIFQGVTNDTIYAPDGSLSDHYTVYFLDANQQQLDPPADEDKKLTWEFDDPTIAEVYQHEGEEGGYELHIRGLKEGTTMVEFFIQHAGHNDYRSGKIPVVIQHAEHGDGEPHAIKLIDEETGTELAEAHLLAENQVSGALQIGAGSTSDHIEIEFYDEDGELLNPDAMEHSVELSVASASVLGLELPSVDEPWAFKIIGLAAGQTTLTIKFKHEDSVEATFTPIPVTVN